MLSRWSARVPKRFLEGGPFHIIWRTITSVMAAWLCTCGSKALHLRPRPLVTPPWAEGAAGPADSERPDLAIVPAVKGRSADLAEKTLETVNRVRDSWRWMEEKWTNHV